MATKFIIFACVMTISTAASVYHIHPHVPVVMPTSQSDQSSPDLKIVGTSRHDSDDRIKLKPENLQSIKETTSDISTDTSETLLRSPNKSTHRSGPTLRRFRRPRSSDEAIVSSSSELFQRTRRDVKEITSVPPGELLTRKSLQNLASFIAGLLGVFFGPFGPVLSAVVTPYISDIVYALAGFDN